MNKYGNTNSLYIEGSPSKDSPQIVISDEKKSSQSGSELKSPDHINK